MTILLITINSCRDNTENRYDLREINAVTEAKEQKWGTCWAFATVSSLESNYIMNQKNEDVNFSEYYLDKYNGFNRDGNDGDRTDTWYSGQGPEYIGSNTDDRKSGLVVHLGGDYKVSAAFFANNMGITKEDTVSENEMNHDIFGNNENDGIKRYSEKYNYYYPRKIEWLSFSGNKEQRIRRIKNFIKSKGAVASSQKKVDIPLGIYQDGVEIHMSSGREKLDHAISLIGWNDNVKFNNSNGAWIVKDSDHKDEKTQKHIGYFYVMYDDYYVGNDVEMGAVSFSEVKKRSANTVIYGHAKHGWLFETERLNKVKAVYKIKNEKEKLKSIGIFIPTEKTENTILLKIEDKKIELNYANTYPGFYIIDIDEKIVLNKDQRIDIELRSNNGVYAFDGSTKMELLLKSNNKLPKWGDPVEVNSLARSGETFYKRFENSKWIDFIKYKSVIKKDSLDNNKNIAIYLYTEKI